MDTSSVPCNDLELKLRLFILFGLLLSHVASHGKVDKGRKAARSGLLTTNGDMRPGRGSISPFCCGGIQRGQSLFLHTTLCVAKCSVLYALSALPLQMSLPSGRAMTFEAAGKQAVLAGREAVSVGLFSPADWAYMKPPSLVPRLDFGSSSRC